MNYSYINRNKLFLLSFSVVVTFVLTCEFATAAVHADFNNDGYDDLVIGAMGENLSSNLIEAGAIHVKYGGPDLATSFYQFWHQNVGGVEDAASAYEHFGRALATGDFNNDGYDDLAVGVPGDDWVDPLLLTLRDKAGGVNVFYGSPSGFVPQTDEFWTQNSQGILDSVETDDRFGSALAAGDFNNDGFDDLAIGVPREDVDGISNAGAVNVLYGTANGLSAAGDQFWHQGSNGVLSDPASGEQFGSVLAAGDFDSDGFFDLAIGVSSENVNGKEDAGAVNILYGTAEGLTGAGDQFWDEDNLIADAKAYDYFGSSLTVGNFNGDSYDDLIIGVPYRDATNDKTNVGAALVLYGSSTGVSPSGMQMWMQNNTGFPETFNDAFGVQEKGDLFGWALAAGDFNGDSIDDLAVGVPGEDYFRGSFHIIETGAVNVIYGSQLGLVEAGKQFWNQDNDGITDIGHNYDWYGGGLTAGDYNNDGYGDLAIGTPFKDIIAEDHQTRKDAGLVYVRFGSPTGICESATPGCLYGDLFTQTTIENPEPGEYFGWSLD